MLDIWAGGLHATGGMIEAAKSYCYLLDFKWNTRKKKLVWEYKSMAETPATIYLRHPGSAPVPLQRKEVWETDPDGTLGTYIAMDGNQYMVAQSLMKKVDAWADKIRSRQLTATEGWLSIRSGISMSIKHQLATSRLSKGECRKITKKLKMAALRACGISTTFPDTVVYSPKEFLGIQAVLFIEQCLRYGSIVTDPTGILLRTVIQFMQVEMGVRRHRSCTHFNCGTNASHLINSCQAGNTHPKSGWSYMTAYPKFPMPESTIGFSWKYLRNMGIHRYNYDISIYADCISKCIYYRRLRLVTGPISILRFWIGPPPSLTMIT